jgi:micrococcal nuclease
MRYGVLALLLILAFRVDAYPLNEIKLFSDDIVSIYDGDTFTVSISWLPDVFGNKISVRIMGIDTPEIRSTCSTKEDKEAEVAKAKDARDILVGQLSGANVITLKDIQRDKYFRILATVEVDGRNVNDLPLALGLAVPYTGGTKPDWCGK